MDAEQWIEECSGFFSLNAPGHSDVEQYFTPENFRSMFREECELPDGLTWEKVREEAHRMIEERSTFTAEGTTINARTGILLEEGEFTVRELTQQERDCLPDCVAKHESEEIDGVSRVCMSVESETTHGGYFILVHE